MYFDANIRDNWKDNITKLAIGQTTQLELNQVIPMPPLFQVIPHTSVWSKKGWGVCITTINQIELSRRYFKTFQHGRVEYSSICRGSLPSTWYEGDIEIKITCKHYVLAKGALPIPPRSLKLRSSTDRHVRTIYGTYTVLQWKGNKFLKLQELDKRRSFGFC